MSNLVTLSVRILTVIAFSCSGAIAAEQHSCSLKNHTFGIEVVKDGERAGSFSDVSSAVSALAALGQSGQCVVDWKASRLELIAGYSDIPAARAVMAVDDQILKSIAASNKPIDVSAACTAKLQDAQRKLQEAERNSSIFKSSNPSINLQISKFNTDVIQIFDSEKFDAEKDRKSSPTN
jgi:hypothetical protein